MNKNLKKSIEFKIKKNFQEAYSLYNPQIKPINGGRTMDKIRSSLKIKKSSSLSTKFYKLLLKSKNKKMNRKIVPNVIDKNTFIFKSELEHAESIERRKKEGDKKHLELCKISNKKKIAKLNSAKEFRNRMKLIVHNNIENIQKIKNLEEKKQMKKLVSIRKSNNYKKKFISETKQQMNDRIKEKEKEMEKLKKKLQIENAKVKNKYNEIMKKIRGQV
jgi:hypothetical protein